MRNEGQPGRKLTAKMNLGPSPQNKKVLAPSKGLRKQPSKPPPFDADGLKDGTRSIVKGKRHTVQY